MKNLKLKLLAISFALFALSQPAVAEDDGFFVENSIRQQIFLELKSNVNSLYRGIELLVPEIDQAEVARIAQGQSAEDVVLPANAPVDFENDIAAEQVN